MKLKILGHIIDEYSPDKLCEKIGIAKFEDSQLLESFLESIGIIDFAYRNETNRVRDEAHLNMAPTAYEAYKRFYRDKKRTINFKHPSLIDEPEESSNTILFWSHPVRIDLLYRQMLNDGLYKPNLYLYQGSQ